MEWLTIRLKRLDPQVPMPAYKTPGAAAFDLAVVEGGVLAPGERRLFRTGLAMEIPADHALFIFARSSNAKKGVALANGVGVLDHDFCGPEDELRLALHNIGGAPYEIQPYERLAQGMILPVPHVVFLESELTDANRGSFGSTG